MSELIYFLAFFHVNAMFAAWALAGDEPMLKRMEHPTAALIIVVIFFPYTIFLLKAAE